jgi:hypothetical protein
VNGRKAEFLPLFSPLLFSKWEEELAYSCPFAHFAASTARWFEVHPNEPGTTMRQTFSFFVLWARPGCNSHAAIVRCLVCRSLARAVDGRRR